MPAQGRKILRTVFLLLLLLFAAAILLTQLFIQRLRPQGVAILEEITGLPCTVEQIFLLPGATTTVYAHGVRIGHPEASTLSVNNLTISLETRSLLRRELKISSLDFHSPSLDLLQDTGGLRIGPRVHRHGQVDQKKAPPLDLVLIERIRLKDASFRLLGRDGKIAVSGRGIEAATTAPLMVMEHGRPVFDGLAGLVQGAAIAMNIAVSELRAGGLAVTAATLTGRAGGGLVQLDLRQAQLADGSVSGRLTIRQPLDPAPVIVIDLEARGIHVADLPLPRASSFHITSGTLDLSAAISHTAGKGPFAERLSGRITTSGRKLLLEGIDLDRLAGELAKSQEIGLLEIGSFLAIGPLGPLAAKAYHLAGSAGGLGKGTTMIERLAADWRLAKGLATAEDVALATSRTRIACQGVVSLIDQAFQEFKVALLDKNGCPKLVQTMNGPLHAPEIKKRDLVTASLIGPLVNLLQKGASTLKGEPVCQPFYNGRVAHPAVKR